VINSNVLSVVTKLFTFSLYGLLMYRLLFTVCFSVFFVAAYMANKFVYYY